jgi:hemin uptake protein HemP
MRIVIIRECSDSTNSAPTPPQQRPRPSGRAAAHTQRRHLRGAREIVIEHDGRQYQLRITQNGKLILTA